LLLRRLRGSPRLDAAAMSSRASGTLGNRSSSQERLLESSSILMTAIPAGKCGTTFIKRLCHRLLQR
jgi:hypothetical protein